jgi:hypothetical protein
VKALPAEIHQVGESEKGEVGETTVEVFDIEVDGMEGERSGPCSHIGYQGARAGFVR